MTKKMLVAFNPKYPTKVSKDFLLPVINPQHQIEFIGIASKKKCAYGVVILTETQKSEFDLFAKLVDEGIAIPDVDQTLSLISDYLEGVSKLKIGNIIKVTQQSDILEWSVISNTPSEFIKKQQV